MKFLKGYVRNQHWPKASIIKSYITEEVIEFCGDYLSNVVVIGVSMSCHEGKIASKGTLRIWVVSTSHNLQVQALLYVFHNNEEVEPYLDKHMILTRY